MPSHNLRDAEGVARQPAVDVGADEPEQQADQHHADRLDHRAVRQHDRGDEAEHHQREIIRRVELLRDRGERRAERRDEQRADAAGEERAERRDAERGAGAALLRHLVAVDAGDDRGRLARHVDQDRRGRAAVLRAVIDAGEHDQRRQRIEPEGDRQQHRDGRDRADAGQHADQRAEQAAEQREAEILAATARRRSRSPDSAEQIEFHQRPHQAGSGCAERVDEHADREQREADARAAAFPSGSRRAAHRPRRSSAATAVSASPIRSIRKPKTRMAARMNEQRAQVERARSAARRSRGS